MVSEEGPPAFDGDAAWEQLMLLRNLTKTTGLLHDAQLLQLKMWSLVFSSHVSSCEMHIDQEKQQIDFHLKTKGRTPADFQERCGHLVEWVQKLLGGEWLVRIKIREKLVHRGMRKTYE